jgi:hypothetical protein
MNMKDQLAMQRLYEAGAFKQPAKAEPKPAPKAAAKPAPKAAKHGK